jgi:NAD(P)-dependent dehydrogenase (short-subunit alcohol dehydrogenase family)
LLRKDGVKSVIPISMAEKVAIVTGAAQGIGRAIALKFAEAGIRGMAVLDLKNDESARALERDAAGTGSEVLFLEGDVGICDDVKRIIDLTVGKWGRLDILVNNAGLAINSDFFSTSDEQWNRILTINLSSVFYGMKYAAEYMKKQGGGCIVNMSSISGVTGGNTGPDYGASKAGIIALTKYGAKTLIQHNIRVNAVAPGTIETALIKREYAKLDPEALKKRLSAIPMGRMGTPEEVANVVVFLASDLASYINGETIMVTGGRTA